MPSKYGASADTLLLYESNISRLMSTDNIDIKCELVDQIIDNIILSRNNGVDIIGDIEELKVLKTASEYLLLSLIYTLLATNGLNLAWLSKRNTYWNLYEYWLPKLMSSLRTSNGKLFTTSGLLQL